MLPEHPKPGSEWSVDKGLDIVDVTTGRRVVQDVVLDVVDEVVQDHFVFYAFLAQLVVLQFFV